VGRKKPKSMLLFTVTVITPIEWSCCQYHTKKLQKHYKTKSTFRKATPTQESDNIHVGVVSSMSSLQQIKSKHSILLSVNENLCRLRRTIISGIRQLLNLCIKAKMRFIPENSSKLRQAILDIAVEEYRMREVFTNIMIKLNPDDIPRLENRYRYFSREVEKAVISSGFRVVGADNFVGKPYDVGMAVKPLNIKNFDLNDELVIDKMIEPVIMYSETVARVGIVKLRSK